MFKSLIVLSALFFTSCVSQPVKVLTCEEVINKFGEENPRAFGPIEIVPGKMYGLAAERTDGGHDTLTLVLKDAIEVGHKRWAGYTECRAQSGVPLMWKLDSVQAEKPKIL